MEHRTVVAVAVLLLGLGAAAVVGLASGGAALEERWISDTARNIQVNHHPVGVGHGAVVAPVATHSGAEELTATSCALVRLAPDTGDVRWRFGIAPTNCTSHALTGPTVADVDGDAEPEVLVASTERALHVLDVETGREAWRVPLDTYGYGPPQVADLLGGPTPEVIVADIGGSVTVVTNGEIQWQRDLESATWAAPIVGDVTGDGRPEIVIGTNDGVVALSPTGERRWSSDVDAISTALVPAGDGPALVVAAESGAIRAVDGATGEVAWTHTGSWTATVGAVGAGADGETLYAGLSGGRVVALDARTGERQWSTALLADGQRVSTPAPVLGDVGGDDGPELVAVTGTGTVAVLDPATGDQLASYERTVPILTQATLADVTGDGAAEIFVRYGDGRVASLTYE